MNSHIDAASTQDKLISRSQTGSSHRRRTGHSSSVSAASYRPVALHADPESLGFVPTWYGEQMLAYGEHRCAQISLTAGQTRPR